MAQRQKQRPRQGTLDIGLRIVAALDFLLGVPLAIWALAGLAQEPAPRDLNGLLFGVLAGVFVLALNGAGLCVLLRQRRLARTLQWLVALLTLAYVALVVLMSLSNPSGSVPLPILLGAAFATALLVSLAVLLQRFGED
ncbi:hypothetical protein [Armatimonas rosea]|uniref:Uncharacterized protein n=1 Tax=Armatimonas rosea TaxID=685828 RepID=A0A7W9SMK0_ARMRO|nr:hypothetical protein [Armatimonas rosea]MBB6049105.1 hypothetical protein [Armatimonas rosea]